MQKLFDQVSFDLSQKITKKYSTSFSLAVSLLDKSIRPAIYSIYGFVRLADEIVDSFHNSNQSELLDRFERDYKLCLEEKISLNPIIHSFVQTINKFNIPLELVDAFLKSMKMDLHKSEYMNQEDYNSYIYGSADVVGLMCLMVFVDGDIHKYEELKSGAMKLGSAFQKVNFLRDFRDDIQILNRSYFPNVDFNNLNHQTKMEIIADINADFELAYKGILELPNSSRLGVYTAYVYYKQLLFRLKNTPIEKMLEERVRISNPYKVGLLLKSYCDYKLNLIK